MPTGLTDRRTDGRQTVTLRFQIDATSVKNEIEALCKDLAFQSQDQYQISDLKNKNETREQPEPCLAPFVGSGILLPLARTNAK